MSKQPQIFNVVGDHTVYYFEVSLAYLDIPWWSV